MSVICATSCPGGSVPVEYHEFCDIKKKRHGKTYFALIACDYVFTDITDAAEWDTARGAGSIIVSPPGILDIPVPGLETIEITGCGQESNGEIDYALNYLTYWTADDLSDDDFFDAIFKSASGYRIIWWDCEPGAFALAPDWVTAVKAGGGPIAIANSNPGFEFSVTQVPHQIEGEGNLSQWSMNLSVKTTQMVKRAFLAGVVAELTD